MQQNKNKLISVFDDVKRIFPDFLKPHVSDFTIYYQGNDSLVVSLYEYGEAKPKRRAIVSANELSTFQKPLFVCQMERTHLTDFQVQLAFLSLPLRELIDSVLEPMQPLPDCSNREEPKAGVSPMITIAVTDANEGVTSLVDFLDCEDMGDPCEVVFRDMAVWFPFHDLPNRSGHFRRDGLCSPADFITKAEDMGFEAKVINNDCSNRWH